MGRDKGIREMGMEKCVFGADIGGTVFNAAELDDNAGIYGGGLVLDEMATGRDEGKKI